MYTETEIQFAKEIEAKLANLREQHRELKAKLDVCEERLKLLQKLEKEDFTFLCHEIFVKIECSNGRSEGRDVFGAIDFYLNEIDKLQEEILDNENEQIKLTALSNKLAETFPDLLDEIKTY